MTAFLGATDAALAVLAEDPPIADVVRRGRDLPVAEQYDTAIDVAIARAFGEHDTADGTTLEWDALVGIQLSARATAGQDAEQAIDGLLGDVFTRMAAADPPEGLQLWSMQPAIQWSIDEADDTLVRASLTLGVQLTTDTALDGVD